jgi:hypothetical protein
MMDMKDMQSPEAYQEIFDKFERSETVAAIRQAAEEFERGEGQPARRTLEKLRKKHGIPR